MASNWLSTHSDDDDYLNIKDCPAVYVIFFINWKTKERRLIYIGASIKLRKRLMQHKLKEWARYSCTLRTKFGNADRVLVKYKPSESDPKYILLLEKELIKKLRPQFNKQHNS